MDTPQKIWFDVIIYPHRSLSERGFFWLMLFICAASFCAGLAFYLMGAWPVVGFSGLDVGAIYVAFRLNYRSAKAYERICLTDDALIVSRASPRQPEQEWRFQPYWVRVLAEPVDEFEGHMVLTSHGRRLRVGDFLAWEEKIELAAALRQALARQREALMYSADRPL